MNSKRFSALVSQAQSGDHTALEKLLLQAYHPVSYQCRKLLHNDQAAEDITKKILRRIPAQLDTLKDPGMFEKWLLSLTAKHCMQALRQQPVEKDQAPRKLHIPGEQLDQRETAMVVDQIVDALPDDLRNCMVLYCCCEIPAGGIAKLTGFEESAVNNHLSRGQALINGQLKKLSQQGVRFASAASLPEMLQTAMYTPRNPKAASAMVNGILGKRAVAAPVPKPAKTALGLKIAVAVVSALLVLMGGLIFFLEKDRQAELEMAETAVTTESAAQPTETSVATTAAETTAETTVETTVQTVETTVETTEAATEATTQPATEPAPQAQQTQGSQTASGNPSATAGNSTSSTVSGSATSGTAGTTSSAAGGNHVHSYQDAGPIGVVSAGCESPGSRLKICFVCGDQVRYTDAAGLPAQGHNYSSKVKAPTEGSEGFTIHTCTRCGKTYMDNYVPKLTPATQPPTPPAPPAPQPEVTPDAQPEGAPET